MQGRAVETSSPSLAVAPPAQAAGRPRHALTPQPRRRRSGEVMRKALLSMMILGGLGSLISAGTLATFNASTEQSASFSTGSLVLSASRNSATACLSTGGTEAGGTFTSNNNPNCDVLFNAALGATHMRPGESTSLTLTLKNLGNLPGQLHGLSEADCTVSSPPDQPFPVGSANAATSCGHVQLSIQDATTCYWGDNAGTTGTAPYITGAALTYPVVITASSNDRFDLVVDGTLRSSITLDPGSYASAASLATQVNGKISTWATATAVGDAIRITSNGSGPTANLTMSIPAATPPRAGLRTLGFIDGSSAAGPGKCAVKTGTTSNSLAAFRTTSAATPVSLGPLAAGTSKDFTVRLSVPSVISDQLQARRVGFELTWALS